MTPIELKEALVLFRNYFGEHDTTVHEHYLFTLANSAISELKEAKPKILTDEKIKQALNALYYYAYHSGHHHTVEGRYTDVYSSDRFRYHEDAVNELLEDSDLSALSELEAKPSTGMFPQGDECAPSIPVPPTRYWKPHTVPDNGDYKTILASVRTCAEAWVPGMRLIGNVQAGDIVRAIDAVECVIEAKPAVSDEEIKRIAREVYPPDTTNDGEPFYTDEQAQRNTYFADGLRYARDHGLQRVTGLTVDKVMNTVEGVLSEGDWLDPVWGPNELKRMDADLRNRLAALTDNTTTDGN